MALYGQALGAAFGWQLGGALVKLAQLAQGGEALGVEDSDDVDIGTLGGQGDF